MRTFIEIINCWPRISEFSKDLEISIYSARAMKFRKNIPAWYWEKLLKSSKKRGFNISLKDLLDASSKKSPSVKKPRKTALSPKSRSCRRGLDSPKPVSLQGPGAADDDWPPLPPADTA